ncbi:MAG TPA: family 10 glycosylhydrolase [Coleofasciculaceae cyanobacterium]
MKRLKKAAWMGLASLLIVVTMLANSGSAQLAIRLVAADGTTSDVTAKNMPRGEESLVLYDQAFGKTTRTNPFGVEVIALPAENKVENGRAYKVVKVTSVWQCETGTEQTECGDAEIPRNGVVLSATGSKRDLLKDYKPGDTLVLQEDWFHRKQAPINVVDPSPETNPAGSGFPGFRASNQLIIYDAGYGRPTTGTNEFGFEVTVENGLVTEQEGSDSAIPAANGFVVSGHGRSRSWLIANAPLGAKLEYDPATQTLTSTIDFNTYAYQFDKRWYEGPCSGKLLSGNQDPGCDEIRKSHDQALRLFHDGREALAAATMNDALERLNRRVWLGYTAFSGDTVRGAWHRPVEKNRVAIGQTLDTLKEAGLNSVFLETFFHGYTIFPSQTFANYGMVNENPKFAGVDLLKLWVEEAHKRGMKVHVWFQTFYGGTKAYMPPGPILTKHPEWANVQFSALKPEPAPEQNGENGINGKAAHRNGAKPSGAPIPSSASKKTAHGAAKKWHVPPSVNAGALANGTAEPAPRPKLVTPDQPMPSNLELGGYFLDPANPAVQDFLAKLSLEIVSRYDVDGIQLDYIRYPASFPPERFSYRRTTWGYTKIARNAFKSRYGVDPAEVDPKDPRAEELWTAWNNFKTEQVTHFVERVTKAIRAQRPGIKISAAVFPDAEAALLMKHQDWQCWARNGWVDFFAPMTLTSAIKVVEHDTRYMVNATNGKVPVYSGIFGPFNDNSAEHILRQINTAKTAGASGYVLFDTAHLSARMLEALKAIQSPQPIVTTPEPVASPSAPVPSSEQPAKQKKRHWWQRRGKI